MRRAFGLAAAAALAACGGGGGGGGNGNVHTYHAAAPVGDFLTLTIDKGAHTIDYHNLTNGDSGTVSYADRADGGMDVTNPKGDLVLCYELPGKAVVCSGTSLGPTGSAQPSLLFGVLDTPLVKNDLMGLGGVGYMQFRTREGGMEVGHFVIDGSGNAAGNAWFPVDQVLPPKPALCAYGKTEYNALDISFTEFANNATLGCVERTESTPNGPQVSRIFGTPSGDFMVDSPSGALFLWRDAASTSFSSAKAGSYTALVYEKHVSYSSGTEAPAAGSPRIFGAAVQISADGKITVTQGGTKVFDAVSLLPFAGSNWQGATKVTSTTPGLFYFMDTNSTPNAPVFVTFFENAMAFATFHPDQAMAADCSGSAEYSYTYGIAVKAQ